MSQFQNIGYAVSRQINQANPSAGDQSKKTRDDILKKKKKANAEKIASGRSKTKLRDLRHQALLDQGVDPEQLIKDRRALRFQTNRQLIDSRRLHRKANEADRNGNSEVAESIRQGASALRSTAEGNRRTISDQSSLLRTNLGDLSPAEQVANRKASEQQLNRSLASTASSANANATAQGQKVTRQLADIGRRAFALENGRPAPEGFSDEALADYARTSSPDLLQRITRGVPLPNANAARESADAISQSAERGFSIPDRGISTNTNDPRVINDVRQAQEIANLAGDAQAGINRRQIGAADAQSRQLLSGSQTAANIAEQTSTPNIETATTNAQTEASEAKRNLNQSESNQQIESDRSNRLIGALGSSDDESFVISSIQTTDQNIDLVDSLSNKIPRSIARLKGMKSTSSARKKVSDALDHVDRLQLDSSLSVSEKSALAKSALKQMGQVANEKDLVVNGVFDTVRRSFNDDRILSGFNNRKTTPQSRDTFEINRDFRILIDKLRRIAAIS